MSMWTDWFIAAPSDAKAIGSIAQDEAEFDDWPHLQMQSIIESSLMALWGILKGTPGEWVDVVGKLLHQVGEADEEGEVGENGLVTVTTVTPRFITALAAITEEELPGLAKQWIEDESMEDWKLKDAKDILREMADFVRQAKATKKPVLQLVVV